MITRRRVLIALAAVTGLSWLGANVLATLTPEIVAAARPWVETTPRFADAQDPAELLRISLRVLARRIEVAAFIALLAAMVLRLPAVLPLMHDLVTPRSRLDLERWRSIEHSTRSDATGPSRRAHWGRVAIAAGGVVVVIVTAVAFPINMDEYLPYHVDACRQPEQQASLYREACGSYPIALGPIGYQRAYHYVGSTSSTLIAPFSAVGRGPWAHLVLGAITLALTGLGLAASAGLRRSVAPAIALVFPLVFAIVRDTGPVRIAMLALAWTPWLLKRVVLSDLRWARAAAASAIVLLWVVATEDKPFFLFLAPFAVALSVTMFAATGQLAALLERRARFIAPIAAAGALSVTLLAALQVPDGSYLRFLASSGPDASRLDSLRHALRFGLSWPESSHRVLRWSAGGLTGDVLLAAAALSVGAALWVLATSRTPGNERATSAMRQWSAVTVGVGVIGIGFSGGWAIHHYAFLLLPFAALLMVHIDRGIPASRWHWALIALPTVIALSAPLWVETRPESGPEIASVMDRAVSEAGSGDLVVCADWGCYYQYAYRDTGGVPVVFATSASDLERMLMDVGADRALVLTCRTRSASDCGALELLVEASTAADLELSGRLIVRDGPWEAHRILTSTRRASEGPGPG